MEDRLKAAFDAGELPGLHSVYITVEGKPFAEAHFKGEDENWGAPLGVRDHGPDTLHDVRSVTKSVVSLLYGIALEEGLVPDVDEPLIAQFPEYEDLLDEPERASILIRHALSMKMGTEWNEDLPYTSAENSEIAMELAADRYRFVLDRPMTQTPGDWWVYNGGATAIIAKLLADGVGMPIDAYAEKRLFAPLGITEFDWNRGADGVPSAASGLRLSIRDLAKIGQMVADDGRVDDAQVVPAAWIDEASAPRADLASGLRYGYFWWLAPVGDPPNWIAGFGNGGQRLSVNRERDIVVVVFAGNYNDQEAWRIPVTVISDFFTPAYEASLSKQ
ncbi:MAG: serine hydrolase [Pseudomonadota bacterium]